MDKRSAVHHRRRGIRWTSLSLVHPTGRFHDPVFMIRGGMKRSRPPPNPADTIMTREWRHPT
ncbi:MAG: hypothetical protein EOM22_15275 [Gammaproteobacteria bacterium]|nr:hypothetical protein [Gammaproteobacteria bacterium]